jgi:hypothetical protein
MAVTTLVAFATQQRDAADAAKKNALEALRQAQDNYGKAKKAREDATAALADLGKRVDDIHKQLGTVPTPADGDALLGALEQAIVESRAAQWKLLKTEEDVAVTKAEVERAGAELGRTTARFDEAKAALAEAEQRCKKREDFKQKRAQAPLATVRDDANAALNTAPKNKVFLDAKTRIEADIPKELRDRARERLQLEAKLLDAARGSVPEAQDSYLAELDSNGGLAGKTEKPRVELQRAEETLRDFDTRAKERYDLARSLLAQVADKTRDPFTAAQVLRLQNLATAGKPAAAKEKTRDDALKTVKDKEADLAKARLKALAKNVDPDTDADVSAAKTALATAQAAFDPIETGWVGKRKDRDAARGVVAAKQTALEAAVQKALAKKVDPATDAGVVAAKADLATARAALDTAETAYRGSDKGALDAWEAAVPDTAWHQFYDFEEAQRLLTLVKDTDPAALEAAVTTAEAALVAALLKAGASTDTLGPLEAERQRRAARREFTDAAAPRLLFGALRGDR